ncbi:hypothetical protein KUTeg_024500 [Tegillarca granosa]|uniref:Oxo-4-hydroxy-4-carboxy-5-ureidoimidazoline decarboxylase domain-containing protein n=1 Tax=Tegillarca granosa TaxID=220873 RepID=A0ABQ9DY25_TEGGR|nr:hypothetical protein KUTeg_024500 [Tegillarca granosa]
MPSLSFAEVNRLTFEEFITTISNAIELCPWGAETIWTNVPFSDIHNLSSAFNKFIDNHLPESGKC